MNIFTVEHNVHDQDTGYYGTALARFTSEQAATQYIATLPALSKYDDSERNDYYDIVTSQVFDTCIEAQAAVVAAEAARRARYESTEEDEIYELASLEAAERDSPNSPDYEQLVESISERIYNERHPS